MTLTRHHTRLAVFFVGMREFNVFELVGIVRERRYPTLMRLAALRVLIGRSPWGRAQDEPCGVRRRLVRHHYGV
jgi:hypothetical protein